MTVLFSFVWSRDLTVSCLFYAALLFSSQRLGVKGRLLRSSDSTAVLRVRLLQGSVEGMLGVLRVADSSACSLLWLIAITGDHS